MYTVLWSDETGDHYERCDFREEVAALLDSKNLWDDADVLIFPPEADDLACSPEDLKNP